MVEKSPYLTYCIGKNCENCFKVEEKFLTGEWQLP